MKGASQQEEDAETGKGLPQPAPTNLEAESKITLQH